MSADYEQPTDVVKRVRFFDGQFLKDQDFIDDQKYHIDRQCRPNRLLRVSGICEGLTLVVEGNLLKVTPGTALDGKGRLVVLSGEPFSVDLEGQTGVLDVFISYAVRESDVTQGGNDRSNGGAAQGAKGATRWWEQPRFEVVQDRANLKGDSPIWLGRVTVAGSGGGRTVTLTTVENRQYSGIYLPSSASAPDGPVLRSGGNRSPKLAVLTGDLRIQTSTADNATAGLNITNTANRTLFYVRNDGNVGLGTTDVGSSQLKIASSATDFLDVQFSRPGAGQLQFIAWESGWNINAKTNGEHLYLNRDSGNNSNVFIGVASKELFVRGSDGNVGVGSTNPGEKLEVNGSLKILGARIRSKDGYGILEADKTDWLRINPDENYPAIALYKPVAIGTGGLAVGEWSVQSAGVLKVTQSTYLATAGGTVGIGATSAASKLTVNADIIHDNNFNTYGDAPVTIFEPTHNGGSNPNGTRDILNLVREGVNAQAYGNRVSLAIGRYENVGANSRTQLDIKLTDDAFNRHPVVMSLRSNGNVGVGTTVPRSILDIRRDATGALGPILSISNLTGGAGAGGAIDFNGYDVGTNNSTARIQSLDDGNWSSHLAFLTKAPGANANTLQERLRINSDGNVTFAGIMSGPPNGYQKAQFTMGSGGKVTWKLETGDSGRLKWDNRFIAICMENSAAFPVGHINIYQPTANIPAANVHDGQVRSVNSDGVLLRAWEALYAVHTPGGNESAVGFRIRVYHQRFDAPSNWLLVAVYIHDNQTIKLGTGTILAGNSSSTMGSPIPTGTILMWSGSVSSIPYGWALCDGGNGTPDLRGRFVYGVGNDPGVRIGGSTSHSHSTGMGNGNTRDVLTGVAAAGKSYDNVSDEIHTHSVSASDHLPPYYMLAFIMKL